MKFRLSKEILCLLAIGLTGNLSAAIWNGTTNASWATPTNWTGTAPDNITAQPIVYDNTSTANLTQTLDASYSVTGITLGSATGNVIVNNGTGANTLAIGAGGIDMSAATVNLTFNTILNIGANQSWTVNGGRTLTAPAGNAYLLRPML